MSTSDRFPLAAKACFDQEKLNALASPILSGTRLAFEWNKGPLEPLVASFKEIHLEEPKAEQLPELPPDHDKQPTKDNQPFEGQLSRGDTLACYRPASLHRKDPDQYGIWFFVGKVRWQAFQIAEKLRKTDAAISEDEVLEALIVQIFWHEVGHAWIEDIASTIDKDLEIYTSVHKQYGGYIFDEEAFCNTLALRMLRFYLREDKNAPLIDAMKRFMRSQGRGYRRFEDFNPWGTEENGKSTFEELKKQIEDLFHDVYRFERAEASGAIGKFFHAGSNGALWVTHDASPNDKPVPPCMLNWKHPLHADGIKKGTSQGQLLPKLLKGAQELDEIARKLADESNSATKDELKKRGAGVKSRIKELLETDPHAVYACDFLGPDAPFHVRRGITTAFPSQKAQLQQLLKHLSPPRPIDWYGNTAEKLWSRLFVKKLVDDEHLIPI